MEWKCKGHTYERPGRQMNSFRNQLLVLISAGIVAKIKPFYMKLYFTVAVFLYVLPIFRKLFLEHFRTIGSIHM